MESHEAPSPVRSVMAAIDDYHVTLAPCAALFSFRMCVAEGEHSVATWLPPWTMANDDRIDIARVTLIPGMVDRSQWVATHIAYEPEEPLFDLIPDAFGADDTIVQRLRDVVYHIDSAPLAQMLSRVWMLRSVFRNFWTCPASQAHHHAFRGGLASHSIEMAEAVAETRSLGDTDRDIGIAYALLHDIGKLWCYGADGREHMAPLGHELIGLARLNSMLDVLHHEWPDGAVAMRSLLSGLWKTKGHKPLLAIGKLVQAYDQISAERDLRDRPGHRHQPWAARPHVDNVRPFPTRA